MNDARDFLSIVLPLAARAGLMDGGGWELMNVTKVPPVQVSHMVYKAA